MKKFTILPLVFLLGLISFTSCKKDVEDRLPGDWTGTYAVTESGVEDGESFSESGTYAVSMTFDENGTYIATVDGDIDGGTWVATEELVTLDGDRPYTVITNDRKEQVWEYSETEIEGADNYIFKITITLEKE
jgi:hypothetical protein